MNKMTPRQRANLSDQILKNEVFDLAFDTVKQLYIEKLLSTPFEDVPARDKLFLAILCLQDVRSTLTFFSENGKLDEIQETRKAKAKK